MQPWFGGRLQVSRAGDVFAKETGAITDIQVREQLQQFVHGFVAFVEATRTGLG